MTLQWDAVESLFDPGLLDAMLVHSGDWWGT